MTWTVGESRDWPQLASVAAPQQLVQPFENLKLAFFKIFITYVLFEQEVTRHFVCHLHRLMLREVTC